MKNLKHYVLELAVIIAGISISFYVEKLNENDYKENLKIAQNLKGLAKQIEELKELNA